MLKPEPEPVNTGLQIRFDRSRFTIQLFPLDPESVAFIVQTVSRYGVSFQNKIFPDARTLHIHPKWDFNEVLEYFQSYNDQSELMGSEGVMPERSENGN